MWATIKEDGLTEKEAKCTSLIKCYVMYREESGINLTSPAPSVISNCQWEKCPVCAHVRQSTNFRTFKQQPSCRHPVTEALETEAICFEDSNRSCMFVYLFVSEVWEEHWLKLLPPRGTIHQGCAPAPSRGSLPALSTNERQGSTSNSWQNLDKRGIFYSQLSRKGRRSETLGIGGTELSVCLMRKHDQSSRWHLSCVIPL